MNLIDKAIERLQPSKPIFKIVQDKGWDNKNKARLEKLFNPDHGDIKTSVEKLVSQNYAENFDNTTKRYVVNRDSIVEACKREIKETLVRLLTKNMTQKFPMETKMGLFYRDKLFTKNVPALDNAVISTYNFFADKGDVQNTMKLLEFLFIKHQNDIPEELNRNKRRKRRRR